MNFFRRSSLRGVVALVILAAVAAISMPGSAETAAPTATINPSAALVDGQTVSISGSGFAPNSRIDVAMCAPAADSIFDCDTSAQRNTTSDAAGSFTVDLQVIRFVRPVNDDPSRPIDCVIETCTISAALGYVEDEQVVFTPVSFAEAPPHSLEVAPLTGLIDHQDVRVRGTGFLRYEALTLGQCPPAATVDGDCPGRGTVRADYNGRIDTSLSVSRILRLDTQFDCLASCSIGLTSSDGFEQFPITFVRPTLTVAIDSYATLRAGPGDAVVAQATISCDVATPVSLVADIAQPNVRYSYALDGQECSPTAPLHAFLPSRRYEQASTHYALGPATVSVSVDPVLVRDNTDPPSAATDVTATVQLIDFDQVAAAIHTALLDPNNTELRALVLRGIQLRAAQDPVFRDQWIAAIFGGV